MMRSGLEDDADIFWRIAIILLITIGAMTIMMQYVLWMVILVLYVCCVHFCDGYLLVCVAFIYILNVVFLCYHDA